MRHLLLTTLLLLTLGANADTDIKVRISHFKISVEIPNDEENPIRCRGSIEGLTIKGRVLTKKGVHTRVLPGEVAHIFLHYDGVKGDFFNGGSAQFACHSEGQKYGK